MTRAPAGLDELLAAATAAGDLPGAIATVVDRDGIVYEGAAGSRRSEPAAELTTDTVIRITSCTKALTTVGVLQLVEQGRLDLDQEVASVAPAFGELEVLEGFDGDEPRLRPPARQATLRQLLSHTAGLGYPYFNRNLQRWHQVTGCPDPLSFRRAFLQAPLVADPGTRWEYGTGVDWAGAVLEEVTQTTLDSYLSEHVFEPLGMTDTSFRLRDEQRERLMPTYARTPDGGVVPIDLPWPAEPEMACGGHGAHSTAGDYGRFLRALLRGGELDGARILREETVEAALSPQLGRIPLPEVVHSTDPTLAHDVPFDFLPVPQSWGLGFHLVLEDLPGMRRAGTGHWFGVNNCYFWLDRASGVAGVFLTQVLPFFDERIVGRVQEFERAAYAEVGERNP